MIISLSVLLRKRNISDRVVEKINVHFAFIIFVSEKRAVYEVMWKNIVEPEWPHNSAHALCMLVNKGYTHTHKICNTYSFPTPTLVTRTRLRFVYNIHCLCVQFIAVVSCVMFKTWFVLRVKIIIDYV